MEGQAKELVADVIQRMNDEREAKAKDSVKACIEAIVYSQAQIEIHKKAVEYQRKTLASIKFDVVTEADILTG